MASLRSGNDDGIGRAGLGHIEGDRLRHHVVRDALDVQRER